MEIIVGLGFEGLYVRVLLKLIDLEVGSEVGTSGVVDEVRDKWQIHWWCLNSKWT